MSPLVVTNSQKIAVAPGLVGTCTVTVSPGFMVSWYCKDPLDWAMNCRADFGLHQSAAGARGDRNTLGGDDMGVFTADTLEDGGHCA